MKENITENNKKLRTAKANQTNYIKGLPTVKLTREQAYEIRYLAQNRVLTQPEIMKRYGISYNLLYRIMNNLSYTEANPTWLKAQPYYGQQAGKGE